MKKTLATAIIVGVFSYFYFNSTHKRDSRISSNLKTSYDYIIVGAGSSGSALAGRLSEDSGNDVVLLEAGGSDETNPDILTPGAVAMISNTDEDWSYYTVPQKHACYAMKEQRSYWPRGRVLGGSSSVNWMVYVRGSRHDYDRWAEEGCDGWSYKDVLPYFIKSEDIQIDEFKNSEYRGTGGPLPVSRPTSTPIQKLYLDAGKELGYNVIDCNGKDQIGYHPRQEGCWCRVYQERKKGPSVCQEGSDFICWRHQLSTITDVVRCWAKRTPN